MQRLQEVSADIALYQEVHFLPEQIEQLKKQWAGEAFEAAFTSRSGGIEILINKQIPFKVVAQHADDCGKKIKRNMTDRSVK